MYNPTAQKIFERLTRIEDKLDAVLEHDAALADAAERQLKQIEAEEYSKAAAQDAEDEFATWQAENEEADAAEAREDAKQVTR